MKPSKRTLEIEARRNADPIAQALERTDIDYGSDDLPTAPRDALHLGVERRIPLEPQTDAPMVHGRAVGWSGDDTKFAEGQKPVATTDFVDAPFGNVAELENKVIESAMEWRDYYMNRGPIIMPPPVERLINSVNALIAARNPKETT